MSRGRPFATLLILSALALSACTGGDGADEPEQGTSGPTTSTSASETVPETVPEDEPTADETPAPRPGPPVRATFFGMHDARASQGVAPDAAVGALRFWDSGTTWRDLETQPGVFTWDVLDTAVATAEAADARPLLVLGQTPQFHASRAGQEAAYGPGAASMPDLGAWRRYVTAVAQRYGDRIDYQVWNETNVIGYWTGTMKQMAELTMAASRSIRRLVPRATVVAPAFALRLDVQQRDFADFWSWQSRGIDLASAVDAVAVHLYPPAEDPPETQVDLFDKARAVLAENGVELPVWNTEINFGLLGGPTPPPIPAELQRAFLMRNYLLNAGLGVQRVYWYRWDLAPIANTMLTTPDYSAPTLAGRALPTVREWIAGTRVQPCELSAGVWSCTARNGGETRTFWWKPQGQAVRLPVAEGARSWADADGRVTDCPTRCLVPVGKTPVMVTSQ